MASKAACLILVPASDEAVVGGGVGIGGGVLNEFLVTEDKSIGFPFLSYK
jgi:hypothetical protein